MTTYTGDRTIDGPVVLRDGAPLEPQRALKSYSSHPMDWGCDGRESRQLAFALLLDHLGEADRALRLVPSFTRGVVAQLDNEWELESEYLVQAVEFFERL